MIEEQINVHLGGPQNTDQECNADLYPDGVTIFYNEPSFESCQIAHLKKEQALLLAKSILTYFSEEWKSVKEHKVPGYLDLEVINPEETGLDITGAFFNSQFKEWRDSLSGSGIMINPKYWRGLS